MGAIMWGVGGWTSRCCGSGSGESIGEKRVDEEVLWLFIACFLIIIKDIVYEHKILVIIYKKYKYDR